MNNRLKQIRSAVLKDIADLLAAHDGETLDIPYFGSAPVIFPSPDDQDQDTYTLDRVYSDKGRIVVDSSSCFNNRSDDADLLDTDTLCEIFDFLQNNEDDIWSPDIEEIEERLMDEYHKQDDCMGDFLAFKKVKELSGSLSIEQVVGIYVDLMHESDEDEFFRENSKDGDRGSRLNMRTGEDGPLEKSIFILHRVANNDGVNDCCIDSVHSDRKAAEQRLKFLRGKFVEGLDEDEGLDSIDPDTDTLTDRPDFFCYHKFNSNHLFQLEIVEASV